MTPLARGALLGSLEESAHTAWRSTGAVSVLLGAPGSGKTHLARQFFHRLPDDTALLAGSALPTGSPPLLPICEALSRANRVTDEVTELLQEYAGVVPLLRNILAPFVRVHRKLERGRSLSQGVAPSETYAFSILFSAIKQLSEHRHVVLFLDDVQWLDESSLAFLGYVLRELSTLRSFVLLAARTNGDEPVALKRLTEALRRLPEPCAHRFPIPPLTASEIREAATSTLGGSVEFSEAQLRWLGSTSRGNPRYLVEVLAVLQSRGSLSRSPGGWRFVREPSELLVPPSLAAVTLERLSIATSGDALAEAVIQFGAALGRSFEVRTVARALGISSARVLGRLTRLELQTGYVSRDPGRSAFTFDHDLTREAIIQVLGARVASIHRSLADALLHQPQARARDIARHFQSAREWHSAARYFATAAHESYQESAFNDSVTCALEYDGSLGAAGLGVSSAERLDAVECLATALLAAERYSEAVALIETRIEASLERGRSRLAHLFGRAKARLADDEAHRSAEHWLRAALSLNENASCDPVLAAEVWTDLVYVYDSLGDYARSAGAFRTALGLAQAAGARGLIVRILRMSCMFFQPEFVIQQIQEALAIAAKERLDHERGLCLNNLGTAFLHLGDLAQARCFLAESRRRLRELGGYRSDFPTNNLGVLSLLEGSLDGAVGLFQEALGLAHDPDARLFIRSNLALARALSGGLDDAIQQWRRIIEDADATGDVYYSDCTRHNLANALLEVGSATEAISVALACAPHHAATDDALVCAKRAKLLLRAQHEPADSPLCLRLAEEAAVLDQTTKPQAWLYRLPWYYCDIEFWED